MGNFIYNFIYSYGNFADKAQVSFQYWSGSGVIKRSFSRDGVLMNKGIMNSKNDDLILIEIVFYGSKGISL